MVALFDVEKPSRNGTRTADWADPEAAFAVVRSHVGLLAPRDALGEIRRYKAQLSAMETHALAAITKNDGERSARRAVDDGKTSKASARRAANRAKVAAKNPAVVDKMASGALSEDHLDVIADTAAKTDGAAAVDDAFIDRVGATTPDQAKAEAEKFVQNHNDPDGVQTEHDRQRAARRGVTYYNKQNGLSTIKVEGDSVAINAMWEAILQRSKSLYEQDGGRDVTASARRRTREQRLFDAAHQLVCGKGGHAAKTCAAKPVIFVGLTLDKLLGLAPEQLATQIGLGLIPDSVLATYLSDATLISVLYDKAGTPLWLARSHRHASQMQRFALIARDRACVLCRASASHCEAHHRIPWHAPQQGHDRPRQPCSAVHQLPPPAPQRQADALPRPPAHLAHQTCHAGRASTREAQPPETRIAVTQRVSSACNATSTPPLPPLSKPHCCGDFNAPQQKWRAQEEKAADRYPQPSPRTPAPRTRVTAWNYVPLPNLSKAQATTSSWRSHSPARRQASMRSCAAITI